MVPDTDGELLAFLNILEETLLTLDRDDGELLLPGGQGGGQGSDAVGRPARSVARGEKTAPQPVAADGRFELVPLYFVPLGRDDRDRILGAVALAGASTHSVVHDVLRDYAGPGGSPAGLVERAQSLAALLSLPCDGDAERLQPRLGRGPHPGSRGERVVLSAEEQASYERLTRTHRRSVAPRRSASPFPLPTRGVADRIPGRPDRQTFRGFRDGPD